MTAVVPVFNPRAEPRRAVKRGYPRDAGSVRLCRTVAAVERLLYQRLVDAVVLDVKAAPAAALALPARFPRIPMFVLSPVRPDDGALLAACYGAGFAGVLVEGVDNAVAGEWIAARTAQTARRAALAGAWATPRRPARWRPPCGSPGSTCRASSPPAAPPISSG